MIFRGAVVAAALCALPLPGAAQARARGGEDGRGGICVPASERAGREFGCFITARQSLGVLPGDRPVFWYLDAFTSRAAAAAAKTRMGTVVESFGRIWLFTIAPAGFTSRGERVARIGPLPVRPGVPYTAQYMDGITRPGQSSAIHRHPGPEAWYTLAGTTCLETPQGLVIGRPGGPPAIVPGGRIMQLTASGSEVRRALTLILHESSERSIQVVTSWKPRGLCANPGHE